MLVEVTMQILMFLLFGLVIGALARFFVPGKERGGWIVSIVVGIVGSMVGGLLGRVVGIYHEGEPAGFVMSLLGAMAVVAVYHAIAGRRSLA
jgi:uncharacterized membrane protein YeaQ/YmgE (transglycosylase-associated protein family)